jgi:hypothetical protein
MKPVAVTLDIIQGEEKAFMGLLLPVLNVCVEKLKNTKEKNLIHCEPLVDALLVGISSRFCTQLDDLELILASAFHPQFKLSWYKGDELNRKRIMDTMTRLVNEKLVVETQLSNSSSDSEDNFESFFNHLMRASSKSNEGARLVKNYLESPLSTTLPCPSVFPCKPFVELFISYNTPIPSSAAVERMFSLGKDVLKPKRASLSDDHFEMLVFLKGK